MSIALPLAGALLAALAVYFSSSDAGRPRLNIWHYAAVAVLAILGCLVAPWQTDRALWSCVGALLGALVSVLAAQPRVNPAASAAIGIAAAMTVHLVPGYGVADVQMTLLALAGLGAIITAAYPAALGALVVVALDAFGRLSDGPEGLAMAGSMAGLLLLLGWIPATFRKLTVWAIPAVTGALILIFQFVPSFLQPAVTTLLLGVGGAVLLNLLLPAEDSNSSLATGIGVLISVGLATASYALFRGTGMAACLLGSMGVLLLMQNPRAMLALGPLLGLVLYRLLRNLHPDTTRAFDIGQHYALVGLLIGAILPLILGDSEIISDRAGKRRPLGLLILAIVAASMSPLLLMFLGQIGVVGFVVGLGCAGLLEAIRRGSSLVTLASGVGMAGVLFAALPQLKESVDLARDEKIRLLLWATLGIFAASAAFTLLTRKVKE